MPEPERPVGPPSPEEIDDRLEPGEEAGKKLEETRSRVRDLDARHERDRIGKTVGDWMHGAQERIVSQNCPALVDAAIAAASDLPPTMKTQWAANMERIKSFLNVKAVDGTKGDPLAILRSISTMQPQLDQLRKIASIDPRPETNAAVAKIEEALDALMDAIERAHPAVSVKNPMAFNRDSTVQRRGSHLMRTGVFLFGATIGAAGLALAAFAKPEDKNFKFPAIFLSAAALAAGWGSISRSGSERLAGQIDFLIDPAKDWERLAVRGPDWADFARNYYRYGARNPEIASLLRSKSRTAPTDAQINAVMSLAPSEGVREQLIAMLGSRRDSVPAADFKLLIGYLNTAKTDDARGILIGYIASGTTRASIRPPRTEEMEGS